MFYLFIGFYVSEFLDKARTNIHSRHFFAKSYNVIRPFYQLLFSIPKKFNFTLAYAPLSKFHERSLFGAAYLWLMCFSYLCICELFSITKERLWTICMNVKGIAKMIFIVWFQWRWIFSWTVAHLLCLCSQKRVENNFTKNGCCKWLKIKASNAIWKDPIDQPHPTSMVLR